MVQRIDSLNSQPGIVDASQPKATKPNGHSKHWNASSIAPASDPYDLDVSVKPHKNAHQLGPNSASTCSCTCGNTCSGCVTTDSGCTSTSAPCNSTDHKCGWGD